MNMNENEQKILAKSRCWVEISESRLRHNLREIRKHVPPTSSLLAVVKANAYGHGAAQVARIALEEGARYLAVACLEEALELREAGVTAPILILSPSPAETVPLLCRYGITQTVGSAEEARGYLSHHISDLPALKLHIKFDTGMGRLGWSLREEDREQSMAEILSLKDISAFDFEGALTHFATASAEDESYHELQFSRFQSAVCQLRQEGFSLPLAHCANSATIVRRPDMAMDMVRAGIILYGGRDGDFMKTAIDLQPVMCLKAKISAIRELAAGEGISYGLLYRTPERMRIGIVECGYADGFQRALSGKALLSLHGQRVPQLGRICMDRMMVDLRATPEARVGDVLTLLGGDSRDFVDPDEQAERAGTISYELFCDISQRVPRFYLP